MRMLCTVWIALQRQRLDQKQTLLLIVVVLQDLFPINMVQQRQNVHIRAVTIQLLQLETLTAVQSIPNAALNVVNTLMKTQCTV